MNPVTSDLIDSLARRVRDPNNTAHPRDLVRDLLDRVQVLVNAKEEFITTEQPLITTPGKAIYSVQATFGDVVLVKDIDLGATSLNFITSWRDLWKLSPTWLTDVAPTPNGWTRIGRTLLVLYPAPNREIVLTVTSVKRTTELVSEDSVLDFESQDADLVRDAVLAILLWRQKDNDTASLTLQQLVQRLEKGGENLTGRVDVQKV